MENYKTPLLSICIPTYNRAEYLRNALDNITKDDGFDERVEIVISDNASTDNTPFVVKEFSNKYHNITYYKNEENIKDQNFILALSRGKGKYVRLFNDTLRLEKGTLEYILKSIEQSSENTPLFFYQNISFLNNTNKKIIIDNIDDFLNHTSYWVTWIANFGNWKKEIKNIPNPTKCSELQLAQVDWTYEICKKHKKIEIHFGNFVSTAPIKNKGGYNIYKVFITNYLKILRSYNFSFKSIEIEKFRLLKHFITPWYINLKLNKELTFKQDHKWKILFNEYWFYPFFYILIIYWWLKIIKYLSIKKIKREKHV